MRLVSRTVVLQLITATITAGAITRVRRSLPFCVNAVKLSQGDMLPSKWVPLADKTVYSKPPVATLLSFPAITTPRRFLRGDP